MSISTPFIHRPVATTLLTVALGIAGAVAYDALPLGRSLSEAVPAIEEVEREIGLPSTIHGSFQGAAQAFQDALSSEPALIAAALVTVYIVLGVLYESLIHPLTILSTLPSARGGEK
jgi:multidrug efflux pump